ncbi:superoxide dismutase [Sphingomonas sp. KC8]|jgi:Cu-Zn family superoxide dismutase|nr:superoxide dismutase [Sphingomonas sp. KC8]
MKSMKAALAIAGLAMATAAIAQTAAPPSAKGDIVQAGGPKIGEVTLTNGRTGVLLRLTASGLTPGMARHALPRDRRLLR